MLLRLRLRILIVAVVDTTVGVATLATVVEPTTNGMEIPTPRGLRMLKAMEAVVATADGVESPKSSHTPTLADDGTAAATHNVDPAI